MLRLLLTAVFFSWLGYFMEAQAQDSLFKENALVLHTDSGDIYGTLATPATMSGKVPVALIIAGSGPTDRNGNNPMMKNESLRMLAKALAMNHIASLRFDKRGIAESKAAGKSEADLRFENYITDARSWLSLLKKDQRFSKLVVIGHSEGSLIGMIAAKDLADNYISIAGAGRPADSTIREQLSQQPQAVKDACFPILDSLRAGKTVAEVNPMLYSLFRPSVQPYMISWFHYDPRQEISKLSIPVLIVQGNHDLQVSTADAEQLHQAKPQSQLAVINNMNHLFKIVADDRNSNIASYNDPSLPVAGELVSIIVKFITER